MSQLTPAQLLRYERQLRIPDVGREGQERLADAKVLIVGAGGLGSPAALYLAAAGVGTLGIVDFDQVDASNLQRQILHRTRDVGRPKTSSARETLGSLNPETLVQTYDVRLAASNALGMLDGYDVVIDCSDNFPTRYLVNDSCVLQGKPNVYGSVFRFEGQASVFDPPRGPCYRCLYPEPPAPGTIPSCAEGGVLGVVPGIIGVLQATEAVKLILGIGTTLAGRLLLYDALKMDFREIEVPRDRDCPACGDRPALNELIKGDPPSEDADLSPRKLRSLLSRAAGVLLLDVREPWEYELGHLEGARHVPLGSLASRAGEISGADTIVVYCRRGQRSLQALGILSGLGFGKVKHLRGGIDAWEAEFGKAHLPFAGGNRHVS